jgi:hypothetical protein
MQEKITRPQTGFSSRRLGYPFLINSGNFAVLPINFRLMQASRKFKLPSIYSLLGLLSGKQAVARKPRDIADSRRHSQCSS